MDREARLWRANLVLEPDVEQALVPIALRLLRQPRARQVGPGFFERSEAAVPRQGHPGGDDAWVSEAGIVFKELDLVGDPQVRRFEERIVRPREVQEAHPAGRIVHVAHGAEGHANQPMETRTLRL